MLVAAAAAVRCNQDTSATTRGGAALAPWRATDRAGTLDLLSVDLIDPLNGWAVGDIDPRGIGGAVFHTIDGGRHWAALAARTEVATSVHFIDRKIGWIAGHAGRIDRTDDGGVTWQPQRPERGRDVFNAIWAVDDR